MSSNFTVQRICEQCGNIVSPAQRHGHAEIVFHVGNGCNLLTDGSWTSCGLQT